MEFNTNRAWQRSQALEKLLPRGVSGSAKMEPQTIDYLAMGLYNK